MKDIDAWKRVHALLTAGEIAHHMGGDAAAIFDQFDAEVEASRTGYITFDDRAWQKLKDLVHEMIKEDV